MANWYMVQTIRNPSSPWEVWQMTDESNVHLGTAASFNEAMQRLDLQKGDHVLVKNGQAGITVIWGLHIKPCKAGL